MKKFFKSILCLALALSLALSLAACGCGKGSGTDATDASSVSGDNEAVETRVVDAIESVFSFNDEEISEYVTDPEVLGTILGIGDISELIESMIGTEITEEQAQSLRSTIDSLSDLLTVTVISSEFTDSTTAVVSVEISCPDFATVDLAEYISDDAMVNAVESALSDHGYSLSEVSSLTGDDLEEANEIVVEAIINFAVDVLEVASYDAALLTETYTFTLNLADDKWMITDVENDTAEDTEVVKIIEEQGAAMESSFKTSFEASSGGLTCECDIYADGTTIVMDVLIDGLNDCTDDVKEELQTAYNEIEPSLEAELAPLKDECESLTAVTYNICEEDGDVIATVTIDLEQF